MANKDPNGHVTREEWKNWYIEHQKYLDAKFDSIDNAVGVAKNEMDRRLEGMNEFRDQLTQQSATFVPRSELIIQLDKIEGWIKNIEKAATFTQGSKKWSDHIVTVLIGMAVILAVWIITS